MHYKKILISITDHIREKLQSEEFLNQFKEPKRFVRKRLLSMYQTIMYLLFSNRASMSINLGNIRTLLPSLEFPVISKQAVSKARQHIDPELFKKLFEITVNDYYSFVSNYDMFRGYHLFAIDGSQIHMAYSESVKEQYGIQGDSRYKRKHYMGLGSVLYDVSQDMIVDAAIEHSTSSERALAKQHLHKLKEMNLSDNALLLFDRGYYSAELFNYLISQGFHCLMRVSTACKTFVNAEGMDEWVEHDELITPIRVLKVILDTGETEYLVTDIKDTDFTADDFKELYFKRWKIESKYYELKEQWDLEKFNGATSRAVEQEFYITLFKSNYCAVIKNAADKDISSQHKGKKQYQCCRSHLIGRISVLLPRYLLRKNIEQSLDDLYKEALRNKSLIRKGRKNKRKMPRNQKMRCKNRKTTT